MYKLYTLFIFFIFTFRSLLLQAGGLTGPSITTAERSDTLLLLIRAAEKGDAGSVIKLIDGGADVNSKNQDGVTPLMYAASNGHTEIVQVLVNEGAEIDAIPWNGITALASASINDHYETTLYLLQQGADTEIEDNDGITPLLYSAANNLFDISELLLMFGANPMHRDLEGATALHAAAIWAQPDIVWILIDYGAEIDARDNYGFTPLMMAVQLGRTDMVEYLLENNADIRHSTIYGFSVLAIAVANNQAELAKKLIELGADPHDRISYAHNLMNLAKWQENDELISLLHSYGIRANLIPDFRVLRISGNILMNTGDFFNGPRVSLEDSKYNLLLSAGWSTRPVRRAVLVEHRPGWYDQLWEQRHLFYGSFQKMFPLPEWYGYRGINRDGLYAGFSLVHSRGRYWGTYRYPAPRWHFSLSAGYYKTGSWWFYQIGYEYLQLGLEEKSPHRIGIGAGIRFNIVRDPVIYRTTYW